VPISSVLKNYRIRYGVRKSLRILDGLIPYGSFGALSKPSSRSSNRLESCSFPAPRTMLKGIKPFLCLNPS
ncbi:MAG: hypothetical protein QW265_04640, partial [Candidatus Bathyarchaeia archaeon]